MYCSDFEEISPSFSYCLFGDYSPMYLLLSYFSLLVRYNLSCTLVSELLQDRGAVFLSLLAFLLDFIGL